MLTLNAGDVVHHVTVKGILPPSWIDHYLIKVSQTLLANQANSDQA
jgi:hypothetical protein